MSATTEAILTEIEETVKGLNEVSDTTELEKLRGKLKELNIRLVAANQALTEGKQVLKG